MANWQQHFWRSEDLHFQAYSITAFFIYKIIYGNELKQQSAWVYNLNIKGEGGEKEEEEERKKEKDKKVRNKKNNMANRLWKVCTSNFRFTTIS